MKDDALRVRRGQMRTRMPEFVYTWFAPPSLLQDDEKKGFAKNKRSEDEAVAEADENRWALYVVFERMYVMRTHNKTQTGTTDSNDFVNDFPKFNCFSSFWTRHTVRTTQHSCFTIYKYSRTLQETS